MKNTMKTLFIALLFASAAFGQLNTLVQTTLTNAITATQSVFAIGSATGVVAPSVSSGAAGSALYIVDVGQVVGELVNVQSISGTTVTVSRAFSRAKSHLAGAMILVATAPNWFNSKDPSGSCTLANTYVTPVLNVNTGAMWVCSAKTLSWVPGWNNPFATPQINAATAVASVAGTTGVDGPVIHVSGTNAITAFLPGIGWNGQGFCAIPDAIFTTTTGGTTVLSTRVIAIALATTAVVNKALCYTYDFTNSKFVPSY